MNNGERKRCAFSFVVWGRRTFRLGSVYEDGAERKQIGARHHATMTIFRTLSGFFRIRFITLLPSLYMIHSLRRALRGESGGGEGDLEIEAAGVGVEVKDLAGEVEAGEDF